MSETAHACESCGMPIAVGRYCAHCVDDKGTLQDFPTRFERMVAWTMRRDSGMSRSEAEQKTIDYMAAMPAWREHPSVIARLRRPEP